VCGDEYTNTAAGEECDTGLDMDTPTCIGFAADPAFACTSSRCGDGYVNTAALEACDDRNTSACGTCSADCSTSQPGGDCPLGTGCASIADCNNSDCRGVCVQAP
jgi:cysteine-rich repeat protein